ncbi:hypothetical protein ACQ4M3_00900 [Leptolyngbya sp. AN03gr2]|uniref:hypothetical protein n=1 Tax=unclassified Leptolyngbya TaxID=2650499 RepID=UPI003D31A189
MQDYTIKQGKPTEQDINSLADFLEWLETEAQEPSSTMPDEVCDHLKNISGWRRVIYACVTLIDQCCDPALDYLDWKPEIKQAQEQHALSQQWSESIPNQHPELVNADSDAIEGEAYEIELYVLAHEGNAHIWWEGEYVYVSTKIPEACARQFAIAALKSELDREEKDYVDVGVYHFNPDDLYEQ